MHDWMNELINESMNEELNEQKTNEWIKKVKRKNGCNKEQTSWLSLGNEWMNEWMNEWKSE